MFSSILYFILTLWAICWLGALLTIPSVIVQRVGRPSAAAAWALALFAVPPIALLGWWLLGRRYLKRRLRRRQTSDNQIESRMATVGVEPVQQRPLFDLTKPSKAMARALFPLCPGNQVRLMFNVEAAYSAWEEAIKGATQHIHMLFYIWADDEVGQYFCSLLVAKAKEGVEVRLLIDAIGSPAIRRLFHALTAAGGQVTPLMPMRLLSRTPTVNFRNHRKIIVVDGRCGFIGGVNIGEPYCQWRDLVMEVRGAAVDQLQQLFVDDWFYASDEALAVDRYFGGWRDSDCDLQQKKLLTDNVGCAVVASGPTEHINTIRELLFIAINRAKQRVWIMTPYLLPDATITAALRSALYRGVDVRVLVPFNTDIAIVRCAARAFYPQLLSEGIRIFEYQQGMFHAKATIFDDNLVLIGSANMDSRSFRLNFEVSCFAESQSLNRVLAAEFESGLEHSIERHSEDYQNRSWREQVVDAAAHLLSPLL